MRLLKSLSLQYCIVNVGHVFYLLFLHLMFALQLSVKFVNCLLSVLSCNIGHWWGKSACNFHGRSAGWFSTTRWALWYRSQNLVTHAWKQRPGVHLHSMEVEYHSPWKLHFVSTWSVANTGFGSCLPWSANCRYLQSNTIYFCIKIRFCIISKHILSYKLILKIYILTLVLSIWCSMRRWIST